MCLVAYEDKIPLCFSLNLFACNLPSQGNIISCLSVWRITYEAKKLIEFCLMASEKACNFGAFSREGGGGGGADFLLEARTSLFLPSATQIDIVLYKLQQIFIFISDPLSEG